MEKIQDLLDRSKTNLKVAEDKVKGIFIQDVTEEIGHPPHLNSSSKLLSKIAELNQTLRLTIVNLRDDVIHEISEEDEDSVKHAKIYHKIAVHHKEVSDEAEELANLHKTYTQKEVNELLRDKNIKSLKITGQK